jgi:transcriptional regulator with PAS, ATPase and Fis domain
MLLELLFESDRKQLEELLEKKRKEKEKVNEIIDGPDKKIIRKAEKRKLKRYNLTQTARILNMTRQGLYYWIKQGWIKPKRDYRNYPVFTVFDIQEIIKWRNTIK